MTQIFDYAHGLRITEPRLPEDRDYGKDLAAMLTSALEARLREARIGLGFILSGSPACEVMVKSISALEAELARRNEAVP